MVSSNIVIDLKLLRFFLQKTSWELYASATANDYWWLGTIATASSWVPEMAAWSPRGFSWEKLIQYYGHQELALVYPSSPPSCYQGLGTSIGRASHWRYECVGSISSLVPRPIPSFSMLHAEKRESLVCKIMCMTWSQRNATSPKGRFWKLQLQNLKGRFICTLIAS